MSRAEYRRPLSVTGDGYVRLVGVDRPAWRRELELPLCIVAKLIKMREQLPDWRFRSTVQWARKTIVHELDQELFGLHTLAG